MVSGTGKASERFTVKRFNLALRSDPNRFESLYYEADVAISFARVCPDHTNCEIGSVGNVDAPGQ